MSASEQMGKRDGSMCSQKGCHQTPGSPIPHLPWLLVKFALQAPSPAATKISSQESVELGDQQSGVINILVLTELPSEPNSLSP